MMDKVWKPSKSEYYTPSPEPFKIDPTLIFTAWPLYWTTSFTLKMETAMYTETLNSFNMTQIPKAKLSIPHNPL
jgi:hypothetical protein